MSKTPSLSELASQIPSLLSLARPDPGAWQTLESLLPQLEGGSLEADLELSDVLIIETASRALVLRNVGHAPSSEDAPSSEGAATIEQAISVRKLSGPAMLRSLERSTTEPLAFVRAILETARNLGLHDFEKGVKLAKAARAFLGEAPIQEIDPRGAEDLRALADIYLAETVMHREELRPEAQGLLEEARQRVAEDSDPEILARISELESDLAGAEGEVERRIECLADALGLLSGTPIPGRREETLLQMGRAELGRAKPDRARRFLEIAASSFPPESSYRIRLEIEVALASACLSMRDFGAARQALEASQQWAEPSIDCTRLKGHRLWIEGHLLDSEGEPWRAMDCFANAIDYLLEAYNVEDALRALADWGSIGDRFGMEELQPLDPEGSWMSPPPGLATLLRLKEADLLPDFISMIGRSKLAGTLLRKNHAFLLDSKGVQRPSPA